MLFQFFREIQLFNSEERGWEISQSNLDGNFRAYLNV